VPTAEGISYEELESFHAVEAKRLELEGRGILTRLLILEAADDGRTALRLLRHAFQFPAWFGMNWDAVDDSLLDVDGHESGLGLAVIVVHPNPPPPTLPQLHNAFEYALSYWERSDICAQVFFVTLPTNAYFD
jgi:hypothetical protein